MEFKIFVGSKEHVKYAEIINEAIASAAEVKGTGLAKRSSEFIRQKISDGHSIIALTEDDSFAGFCYIETWAGDKFVANSGLIVLEKYRGQGLGTKIKAAILELTKKLFPEAKIIGLTTSLAVMKINSRLGYRPASFAELTDDMDFWKGCASCNYYDVLVRTHRQNCLCTGMISDDNGK
ncbi:MAG TPA: GNAT family N-acetyltransferase [Flavobacterium sp.]|nr:GNAT family N-acetyltransferase [Flavobacterium sp.]